jgi:uncharacterized membrane protein
VTTGIAFSITFRDAEASPLPLVLVGLLLAVFLLFEGRRYRYFHLYRARARFMEINLYVPILEGGGVTDGTGLSRTLAQDYRSVHMHIGLSRAIGRRLRRTYAWILVIQAIAYYAKLTIHPYSLTALDDLWTRAAIGPIPGQVVVAAGVLFHASWFLLAMKTLQLDRAEWARRGSTESSSDV